MSDGAYILQRIHSHCHEDGDCLIWDRYCNEQMPVMRIDGAPRPVRHVMFERAIGPVRHGFEVISTCNTPRCVAPEHLKQITKKERRSMLAARRNCRGQPMSVIRYQRENHGKLTMEKAREIRSSNETGRALAARFGVSANLISLVRLGKSWAEPSPFSGLGARA